MASSILTTSPQWPRASTTIRQRAGDFSVIESSPLHIQLLPSTFKGEPKEVIHDTNWRAALYGAYNTFIHTDADHVIVDAIPRQYVSMVNRKDPKLLTSRQITLDMSREEALEAVQGLIDVSTLQDLKAKHPKWDFYGWTDDWNSIYYSDQQPGLGAFIHALQPYCTHSCQ
ncbi:hypothetical protein [Larsenimonas rhizosphaerae]|uniref:hypothetical protein n=1 Tax=Larsenimonas rhizosphaerae TaxID=2944682 RepID=UPI0020342AD9|nr:hypothetical protein [Larsenimonas rhizosphaerae]MCM2131446.1 hypothetical protein [Larsenimonas rhizosphaerae]